MPVWSIGPDRPWSNCGECVAPTLYLRTALAAAVPIGVAGAVEPPTVLLGDAVTASLVLALGAHGMIPLEVPTPARASATAATAAPASALLRCLRTTAMP